MCLQIKIINDCNLSSAKTIENYDKRLEDVIKSIIDDAIQKGKISSDIDFNEITITFKSSEANIPDSITIYIINKKTNSTEILCKIQFDSSGDMSFTSFKNNKPHGNFKIKTFDDIKDKYADEIVARTKEILSIIR